MLPVPIANALESLRAASESVDAIGSIIRIYREDRIKKAAATLEKEVRRGKISTVDLYSDASTGGYILRLVRAVDEGIRASNLVILARYLFGDRGQPIDFDSSLEFAQIITELTESDIRCLAVLKNAIDKDLLPKDRRPDPDDPPYEVVRNLPLLDLFPNDAALREACFPLVRFGLVNLASAWDSLAVYITPKLKLLLGRLDLEHVVY